MIAYKVVYETSKYRYVSCIAEWAALVVYSKEKETFPPDWLAEKGYGICCFKTLEQARDFDPPLNSKIWIVKGIKIPLKPFADIQALSYDKTITKSNDNKTFPKGTIMLKSVTFIEEIT